MGLNAILGTAAHSLELFSAGIEVAGQNIANANTSGYVRETLELTTAASYENNGLLIGTGARAVGVRQQIDRFLESQIHQANSDLQTSRARESIYKSLETELNELGEMDLSTSLNDFLAAINDVVNEPDSVSYRQLAVQEGVNLAGDLRELAAGVNDLRFAQSSKVELLAQEANDLIDTIHELNLSITRLESGGFNQSDAGALRTQRYTALNRLSEIISVQAVERDNGHVDVFSGASYLIMGGAVQHLETVNEVDRDLGVVNVRLDKTKSNPAAGGGELRGILDGRDLILGGFVDQLNDYASSLIFEFNRIHSSGQGSSGFSTVTSSVSVTDAMAALNAADLDFTPTHGSFELKMLNQASGTTNTAQIDIDLDGIGANDTTLTDLRDAINAAGNGNVTATITTDGRLKIDAAEGFEVAFAEDSSGVLAALGINTFFTGSDAGNIGVNSVVTEDHELFATGHGGGQSDGSNAVLMAQFIDNPVDALGGASLDTYYQSLVTNVAEGSASESAIAEGFDGFREALVSQREQFSGVSLDEEAILILTLQHAYQAAARVIRTVDELYTELLSL